MRLLPGSLIVLEGYDQTGKSTQAKALATLFPKDLSIHSPSGGSELGDQIYLMTELATSMQPLTRQFLHLASHTEMYADEILPALDNGGVIMDRCWWSTIAYGWELWVTRLDLAEPGSKPPFTYPEFKKLAKLPTQGVDPSLVFWFSHEYAFDALNTDELIAAYITLKEHEEPEAIVTVPDLSPDDLTSFIVNTLFERGLATL